MAIVKRLLAVVVLGGVAAAAPADGAVALHLDLPQLTKRADVVVRGRVVSVVSRWGRSHRRIYTDATVVVDEAYKGHPGTTVTVTRLGGSVGGIGMRVAGTARLGRGQEVILFLRRHWRLPGTRFTVLGMAQGQLTIVRTRAGARVHTNVAGLRLRQRLPDGRLAPRSVRPAPQWLGEVERVIRAHLPAPSRRVQP